MPTRGRRQAPVTRRGARVGANRALARVVLLAGLTWLAALLTARTGVAQATAVPAEIQAALLSKLASYDRNFAQRAGDTARVLLLVKRDTAKSQLAAEEMKSALGRLDRIGGLPHEETVVPFEGADALAARCRAEHIAAVYITPGFDDDIAKLRVALSGVDVLSLGDVPEYVPEGVVLGFDLESGKPKLLVNLDQAKRQNVDFSSDVLRLMKVYR
jgi:hypothetical protein